MLSQPATYGPPAPSPGDAVGTTGSLAAAGSTVGLGSPVGDAVGGAGSAVDVSVGTMVAAEVSVGVGDAGAAVDDAGTTVAETDGVAVEVATWYVPAAATSRTRSRLIGAAASMRRNATSTGVVRDQDVRDGVHGDHRMA